MKLTIIAPTGGVGRQLLAQALDAGHDVTAVARNPAKLPPDVLATRNARIVTSDLATPDPQVLETAVAGADAVLSALGPHNNSDAGIAAPGTRAIITAMRPAGVRRIVAISASPVATTPSPGHPNPPRHDPGDGFIMRHVGVRIAKALFGKVYDDLAAMEDILRGSGLARDADVVELVSELALLHPRDNTFPGEVFLRAAADALDWCGARRADPLPLEGLRERFLPEHAFRGRQNAKFQYAVLAAAALHGGTEPDLLAEVAWWQADDFWQYALFAAVAYVRAAAGRAGVPVRQACQDLAQRPGPQRHNDKFGAQPSRSSDGRAADLRGRRHQHARRACHPPVTPLAAIAAAGFPAGCLRCL